METIGPSDTCGSSCSFMENSLPFENGAIAARRRRMEIRRFKIIANSSHLMELQNKRPRSSSGHTYDSHDEDYVSPSSRKPEYDFVLRHPVDNDERRHEGHPRRPLMCEGAETFRRQGASESSPVWERPSSSNSVQNSSSDEEDITLSSGSGSTSSGSSSMSSDSTSTSLESNEAEGESSITWYADATCIVPNIRESLLHKETTSDNQTEQGIPLQWQGSSAERDQSDLGERALMAGSNSSNICTLDHCPPHGMVSVCGRRREMEDAVAAVPAFLSLPCNLGGCNCSHHQTPGLNSSFHFFGVYDGHGGSQAALFCADRLHHTLAEEMRAVINVCNSGSRVSTETLDLQWEKAMSSCFSRMDAEVGGVCWRGGQCGKPEGSAKCCAEPIAPETVGSTAVVAVVSSCQIIVANCGDSRAVLSRGGQAIALSHDHKPEREDEMERVEAAGGRVIFWNGYRVLGILAMSRAIGDRYLKPYVIAEPEVTCTHRTDADECLILGSDGLWDVLSNEVVCDIARKCLVSRHTSSTATNAQASASCDQEVEESPAAVAAALLTKLALARGSSDNISVVVIDLMPGLKR